MIQILVLVFVEYNYVPKVDIVFEKLVFMKES